MILTCKLLDCNEMILTHKLLDCECNDCNLETVGV